MSASPVRWDAGLYQRHYSFVWKHGEDLVDLLAPRAGERILDAGCGPGKLAGRIAASGARVIGVDSSAEMLAQARANCPSLQFVLGDLRALEWKDEFDGVFSNAVLHWVKPPEDAVRSIAQVLHRGGRFVAEFGGKNNIARLLAAVQSAGARMGIALEVPWYFPGIGEYASLLEKHGFEVRQANLFERWTELEGDGANWLRMFGEPWKPVLGDARWEEFLKLAEEEMRPALFRDGQWRADYWRLRVVAVKE